MPDIDRFGRSERESVFEAALPDALKTKYRRFGPSEKEYTERRYTPIGRGTTWGFTGDKRRKVPGYDVGARPPRGLASLISREGIIGQDPRSTTYGAPWTWHQTDPDDLRGYRASVADVAAMNAEEERNRLNEKYRYALTNPGSGVGLEDQYVGYPAGMADYLSLHDTVLGLTGKDPRDVGTMSEVEYDFPYPGPLYHDTSDMSDYRQSWGGYSRGGIASLPYAR
jgi:hypothetical protein